jgi:hypothetical protein
VLKYQSISNEAEDYGPPLDPEDLAAAQALEREHRAVKGAIRTIRDRMGSIGAAIHQDGAEWNGERAAYLEADDFWPPSWTSLRVIQGTSEACS